MARFKVPIAPRFEVIPTPQSGRACFLLLDHEAVEHGRADAADAWALYAGMFDRKREAVREARAIMYWETVVIIFPEIVEAEQGN